MQWQWWVDYSWAYDGKSLTYFIQECCEANISRGTWYVLASLWIIPTLASWQSLWARQQGRHYNHDLPHWSWKVKLPWCGTAVSVSSRFTCSKYWWKCLRDYYISSGYASLNMSPMMRAPELMAIGTSPCWSFRSPLTRFPVGEIKYDSIATKREEPFPIGVSVIGAPGMPTFFQRDCRN